MQKNLKDYSTIIFDFGGVILDINPQLSVDAFRKIAKLPKDKNIDVGHVFKEYEMGMLNDEDVRKKVSRLLKTDLTQNTFEKAWCLMLQDYKPKRIERIQLLAKTHKLLLLSNTNPIHYKSFSKKLKTEYNLSFEQLFSGVYLSYEMQMLKPGKPIFKEVLIKEKLDPEKTLFIEDTRENTETAAKLGIDTLLIPRNGSFYNYLIWD